MSAAFTKSRPVCAWRLFLFYCKQSVHNAQSISARPFVLKFRLFRRRLTISSPRMSVRSALPWPVRWMVGAAMLGFSAAIGLWAFE
jgi:hypothetical protein